MTADLAAVLTGSLLVVELQLFGRAAVVVPDRLRLLGRGLVQQLWTLHESDVNEGCGSTFGDVRTTALTTELLASGRNWPNSERRSSWFLKSRAT